MRAGRMCRRIALKEQIFPGEFRAFRLAAAWLLGLCLSLTFEARPMAATFEAGGLTFSDELGGFRLLSARGEGTVSDPIVLVEEITGLKPAVLTVRQAGVKSSRSPSARVLLRSLVKVVVNRSTWRWTGFDLELRGDQGRASVYSDGLSFDQLRAIPTPLRSDLFAAIETEDEPYDRVRYDQGHVEPDQVVQLAFNLIDLNPRALFYLAQEPIVLLTDLPDSHPIYAGFTTRHTMASTRSFSKPISR